MNLEPLEPDQLTYDQHGDPIPQLDETIASIPINADDDIRIRLSEYPAGTGTLRIDIRRWHNLFPDSGDYYRPVSKHGINISPTQLEPLQQALQATSERLLTLLKEPE